MKVQLSELPGRTQGRHVQGPAGSIIESEHQGPLSLWDRRLDGRREKGRVAGTEDTPDLKSVDPVGHVGSTPTAATTVAAEMGGIAMKAACEKPGCGEPAVAQARFGEVAVARACTVHAPDLVEFINQHIGSSEPGLVTQNGTK